MRRGEIWLAVLDPARGSEANKTRPVVIVSNNAANATAAKLGRGVVTVVPLTSNISRIFPFQVALPAEQTGLDHDSKAQAEQVRSIDQSRLNTMIGELPSQLMTKLDDALRLQLGLSA